MVCFVLVLMWIVFVHAVLVAVTKNSFNNCLYSVLKNSERSVDRICMSFACE